MRVVKRNGDSVPMLFDKVTSRISKLCTGLNVSPDKVAQKVFSSMNDGIKTSVIDELSADVAINMISEDPDYETLASRIIVSNMHKLRPVDITGIVPERDYDFSYFGIKTLLKMYLGPNETPQAMFMRVASGIHGSDIEKAKETYDLMSQKYFTHATPTLFNAGTPRPQLSSCFLTGIKDDSVKGMYDTLGDCAQISKWSGGIGIHVHNVRANGSEIRGTKGISDGIVPMLRTFNSTARHINQGGGKRKGSFAVYLEPWHADILPFLELRLNQGDEESRCRDLFTALWIPDLFMKRLEKGEPWSLFCPDKAPGLSDVWGQEFEDLYMKYEAEGRANATVPIEQVWAAIIKSQIETGTPYMLYKDHCNAKSNQKHLGTIKSSNLCVAPETLVKTKQGDVPISEIENQVVDVWNGEEWSAVTIMKTADAVEVLKVTLADGRTLDCTPEHKFYVNGNMDRPISAKYVIPGVDTVSVIKDDLTSLKIRVKNIEWTGRVCATYCFTEPKKHMGVFNGILTGQCTEIVEYTDPNEIAVCNLASLCLPKFVGPDGTFDYDKLEQVTRVVTRNLDKIIDVNFYPVPEAERSNKRHRPIAIGVQGLADVYQMMDLEFGSGDLNRNIFETIYWASCSESVKIAAEKGTYETFEGSPWSQGQFQFDMWGVKPSDRYDWESIRGKPIRNSLLVGPMPTATTSQIMGNNECFEPYTSNMYLRRTLAGEFVVLNKHLVKKLKGLGMWNKDIKDNIIRNQGSIQSIQGIPDDVKKVFKTVWEISQKVIIDMAAERGPYVCQSQSMNLHVEDPTPSKLSSIHMYAWKKGLKTGMYYLRTRPKARAIQFTLEPQVCRRDNPECTVCSA
jgi:ribonucleotide reductase alpha subunit